jgi:hypothetical protein
MHGRVDGAHSLCAAPGCGNPGEYKAPLAPANFNGPGSWRLLCLDHVREHNSKYNFFNGMNVDEIAEAQTPYAGWERSTRVFTAEGGDPAPPWRDFTDPLDAIAARFRSRRESPSDSRFSLAERRALSVLGLSEDSDQTALRKRYSQLVRRYHPDRNGGDRSLEARLGEVIDAYQLLKGATPFA